MSRNESAPPRPQLVNWEIAASTAASLTPAGPTMKPAEIARAVENIRRLADDSVAHVHAISRLDAARDLRDSELLVIDRASWSRANAHSFRTLLEPALDQLAASRPEVMRSASLALGGTLTGVQLGTILAFLSSKVLGQYDPFVPSRHGQGGRLMLVAPNMIAVERELNVDPSDFRLWVCLHEQTHRVQFAAAPWLRDHMTSHIGELTSGLMDKADSLSERLGAAVKNLASAAPRSRDAAVETREGPRDGGVLSMLQGPEDKARLSHLTAVMSLLEGHANVVMDGVDGSIVPSVKTIRRRFNARGTSRGPLEKLIRQLMGLDAKMRQYSDGSRFVRRVVSQTGMDGFNAVWESAAYLPTEQEIHAPDEWIDRMSLRRHG
ncbi:zinc-dependent metalloprotease [Arthrobacter echini]|uniref:Zinc-dependent metalloprotease n=1 Tax=Arthrobacter echini TaxID=1529066 RepID=A0A5D0XVD6_9MICC|nr:zinc-dependent metalloprotease [Arthrobacter echini]TYD00629.1 zinc-dependent metalloprotease [Arthrobacter echini]